MARRAERTKKRLPLPVILAALVLAVFLWSLWGTNAPMVTTIPVSGAPAAFDGFRIAHISDLHNASFGENNEKLLSLLAKTEPDLVAITGDLIDAHHTDVEVSLHFVEEALKLAPVYYVTGNHEASTGAYADLRSGMVAAGVTILEDSFVPLERDGETVQLIGLADPRFSGTAAEPEKSARMTSILGELLEESGPGYHVVLSHRPELFPVYTACGAELVLCGHAHGGQVRIPFIGGLVAPDQGFFPRWDAGLYQEGATSMVVSRGLGNSVVPIRVNDRPEIVLVELRAGA